MVKTIVKNVEYIEIENSPFRASITIIDGKFIAANFYKKDNEMDYASPEIRNADELERYIKLVKKVRPYT